MMTDRQMLTVDHDLRTIEQENVGHTPDNSQMSLGLLQPSFTPVARGLLQRQCACGGTPGLDGECAECRARWMQLQRQATNQAAVSSVPSIVHEVLHSPGQPLDASTRAFMEPRFGHDFSRVRVHTDAKAAESAQAVNALAYTVRQHIVFGSGQYAPDASPGRHLIAHELAHVIEQSNTRPSALNRSPQLNPAPVQVSIQRQEVPRSTEGQVTSGVTEEELKPVSVQPKETGLEQSSVLDDFVKKGFLFWNDPRNKQQSFREYVRYLMIAGNEALKSFGMEAFVPAVFAPIKAHAAFDHKKDGNIWLIRINPQLHINNDEQKLLEGVNQNQAAETASSIYHELRHAEQFYRVARMLAGSNVTVPNIAQRLDIPESIAQKAAALPLTNTQQTAEEFAEAQEWERFLDMAGVYKIYLTRLRAYQNASATVKGLLEEEGVSNFEDIKLKLTDFMNSVRDVEKPFFASELQRVEAIVEPTNTDKQVLEHLKRITSETDAALQRWDDGKIVKDRGLVGMHLWIQNIYLATQAAYESMSHEADAWSVGRRVEIRFKSARQAAPVPAPP